ncbi:MAG: flippase-like domain-containing protein [Alphaproteobacteria bacterium]|nr:flippase-like domain-containing protein [Alphaproteobacteria bacterium]
MIYGLMGIEGRGGSAEQKRRLRPTWRGAGMLVIGVVSAALLFVVAPPAEVFSEIGHMRLPWLAAAVMLELCSCLSYVIVFRYFFPEPSRRDSRRVAWIALGTGAVLPGGFISSVAATGLVMRGSGIGMRHVLARSGALLCLLVGVGFLANGVAGALLFAGVPDGSFDLSHTGIPILVSVGVLSGAALIVFVSRRGAERMPRAVRAFTVGLDGAWAAVRRPGWRLLGAVGYTCFDVAALWAACAATGHRLGFLPVLIVCCIGYLTATIPMPAGLGVLDSGLAAALVLYGLPPAASVGAVLVYHAVSIWVPGCGGVIALLSTRRTPITDQPAVAAQALTGVQLAEAAPARP